MIFRRLYKRRVARVFAPYLTAQQVETIFHDLSEWDSFKGLLPRRIYRLFFSPAMTETEALSAVAQMARQTLAETHDESLPAGTDPKTFASDPKRIRECE